MARVHKLEPRRARRPACHTFVLALYTSGNTIRSARALRNLMEVCEGQLKGRYRLEVIDIYQDPGRATSSQIIAAPTLLKQAPLPVRRLIGDLSNQGSVLRALGIARKAEP